MSNKICAQSVKNFIKINIQSIDQAYWVYLSIFKWPKKLNITHHLENQNENKISILQSKGSPLIKERVKISWKYFCLLCLFGAGSCILPFQWLQPFLQNFNLLIILWMSSFWKKNVYYDWLKVIKKFGKKSS